LAVRCGWKTGYSTSLGTPSRLPLVTFRNGVSRARVRHLPVTEEFSEEVLMGTGISNRNGSAIVVSSYTPGVVRRE